MGRAYGMGCFTQVVRWCREKEIGLVLVGPEAPLVAGLVDSLKQEGIRYLNFPSESLSQLLRKSFAYAKHQTRVQSFLSG